MSKLTMTLVVLGTLAAAVIIQDHPGLGGSKGEEDSTPASEAADAAATAAAAAAAADAAATDAAAIAAAAPPSYSPPPTGRYYYTSPTYEDVHGDSACTDDCSGHDAGYAWAERNGIETIDDCGGNSNSFIEGCEAYVEDNS